jgi:hypothetical protein
MLTIADSVLIIVMALLLGQLFTHTSWQDKARTAIITDHRGQHQYIDMQRNQHVIVHGAIGESTLQFTDGRLRFTDSPCTNKICIHNGWIEYGGETVACLPNRLSVQLARNDNSFDAINF